MKTKQEIEKDFDEVFTDYFVIKTGLTEDHKQSIKCHISYIRQNDVDELIEWVENYPAEFTGLNEVRAITIDDLITHLKSLKERI